MPNPCIRTPYFWEEAPFFRPVAALAGGILIYELLHSWLPPRWLWPLVAAALFGILLAGGLRRAPGTALLAVNAALLPLAFVALGILASATRDPRLRTGFPGTIPQGPCVAVLSSDPRHFGSGQSFAVELLQVGGADTTATIRAAARVVCYRDSSGLPPLSQGDTVLLTGRWEKFRNGGNPFEPDLAAAMRRKGFLFRLQTGSASLKILARPRHIPWLRSVHECCAGKLRRHIRDPQAFGLIQAMLLGDEAGFDPALRGLYADTGIIHIVSISGSHVAMLFAIIALLLRWIPGERGAWIRYGTGLVLVWLYVLVAGAPPSALRSAVMFSVVALSTLSKREGRGLNTLCSAAFILLGAEPQWLFAPGFQLSFAAVLSLMLFYQPLQRLIPVRRKPLRWLWQAVCASVAAEILTAPIVAWYFHSFPLMFIPANLLAGIVIGGAGLSGGLLVILLSPVPVLADLTGHALSRIMRAANLALGQLQRLSPEALRHLYLSEGRFLLLMLLIVLLGIGWLKRRRSALLGGMLVWAALLFTGIVETGRQLGQQRMIVYNNGRQALIDRVRGRMHDPIAATATDYHAMATRTALGAWSRTAAHDSGALFLANGRRILLLPDSLIRTPVGELPVDVLVLTQTNRRLRISDALRCFRPRLVVLGSRFSAGTRQRWADSCRARHIPLHDVTVHGAWQAE